MKESERIQALANRNRRVIIELIHVAGSGHPGGSLSVIDLLTAIYETDVKLSEPARSKVILSKGHAAPALYAVLHHYGVVRDDELRTLRQLDSRLQGHPCSSKLPEADATTGLLGQGVSLGIGMAIGKRLRRDPSSVYVICGDGEMNEGQIWEAAAQAAHFKLNNLIMVVDQNGLSASGSTAAVMDNRSLRDKLTAFGWQAETIDGHAMEEILPALARARAWSGGPYAIVAETVKGKGVSFMENQAAYHSCELSPEQYSQALRDLQGAVESDE